MQLADAIKIAYCQPLVGAYFNFHLVDEKDLAGWQSGVYWADGTPKPAYQALRKTAGQVNAEHRRLRRRSRTASRRAPTRCTRSAPPLQLTNLKASSLASYGATITWQASAPANVRVSYGVVDFGVPTAWAPAGVAGGSPAATLIGLDSSTTYRIWVKAVSDDGQRAQATLDITTPGVVTNPKMDVGRPNGSILINGQPWFPMMVYSVCPWEYPNALASGINLFALNPCGNLQSQLNELHGAAYSAGAAGGHGGSGPGIVGWFHYDEPDGANVSADSLPPAPPGVGGLSFLTLTNHFYSGAAPLDWGRGMYPSLIAKADVIGFDLYPLQEWCRPNRMADVYWSQRELVKLSGDKPTFQWIEADDWKCPGGATAVTPAVVRAESWMAIAGGAHGLGFWPGALAGRLGARDQRGRPRRRPPRPGDVHPEPARDERPGRAPPRRPELGRRALRDRDQPDVPLARRDDAPVAPERPDADRARREPQDPLGQRRLRRQLRAARRAHLLRRPERVERPRTRAAPAV